MQVRGTPRMIDDPEWLRAQICNLTATQERKRSEPWNVGDAPEPFISGQLKAIVGVEIPISTIEGKWKVSQNRSASDRDDVEKGLRKEGKSEEMAGLVAQRGAGRPQPIVEDLCTRPEPLLRSDRWVLDVLHCVYTECATNGTKRRIGGINESTVEYHSNWPRWSSRIMAASFI